MILSTDVNIKISNNLLKYYKNLGYNVNTNDIFKISINDLPENSSHKVKVKCDYCENEKEISYRNYLTNIKNGGLYACSRKCAEEKNKNTLKIKYGVNNISELELIKNKKINTCLVNNGVKHPQQSSEIYSKSLNTKKIKYNNPNYNNIQKRKKTNEKKYGYPYPIMNDDIKKKTKLSQFNYFKNQILEKYDENITLELVDYDINDKYVFKCNYNNHNFNIEYKLLWHRLKSKTEICTICNPIQRNISGLEMSLLNFISENYKGEIITNSKHIIKPYELDVYLPDLNLAFEFNGLYWHNELHKDDNYHKDKSDLCEKKGIQLFHIYEDDWLYKQEIIKSMILNKLSLTNNRIFARKCEIKEIKDNSLINVFLNENHLQGFVGSSIKIGLYHNDELVSLMTFGKLRKPLNSKSSKNTYEMLRFCNKLNTNVIGGASKLFNYFIRTYNPINIISYADRSHSNGNLYKQLGFVLLNITQPNYYYIINGLRKYRFGFRKDILIKQGYNSDKTEREIMFEREIYRIYNSGNYKFEYKMGMN